MLRVSPKPTRFCVAWARSQLCASPTRARVVGGGVFLTGPSGPGGRCIAAPRSAFVLSPQPWPIPLNPCPPSTQRRLGAVDVSWPSGLSRTRRQNFQIPRPPLFSTNTVPAPHQARGRLNTCQVWVPFSSLALALAPALRQHVLLIFRLESTGHPAGPPTTVVLLKVCGHTGVRPPPGTHAHT